MYFFFTFIKGSPLLKQAVIHYVQFITHLRHEEKNILKALVTQKNTGWYNLIRKTCKMYKRNMDNVTRTHSSLQSVHLLTSVQEGQINNVLIFLADNQPMRRRSWSSHDTKAEKESVCVATAELYSCVGSHCRDRLGSGSVSCWDASSQTVLALKSSHQQRILLTFCLFFQLLFQLCYCCKRN